MNEIWDKIQEEIELRKYNQYGESLDTFEWSTTNKFELFVFLFTTIYPAATFYISFLLFYREDFDFGMNKQY